MDFTDMIQNDILLMDGAMGTYFNQKYTSAYEAEEANLAHPEQIAAIHKEYIEAGARLIRTNTFAVNHHLFPIREQCRRVIHSAVSSAKKAVEDSGREVLIGASIGPIRQSAVNDDEPIMEEYQFLIDTFINEGINIFVRPRACLPTWSFSCSEKWNVGKQINHLLCGWLELL